MAVWGEEGYPVARGLGRRGFAVAAPQGTASALPASGPESPEVAGGSLIPPKRRPPVSLPGGCQGQGQRHNRTAEARGQRPGEGTSARKV